MFKKVLAMTLMAVALAIPASAQFRWGPKVGLDVSNMHFSKDVFDSSNQTGFTGGIMAEFQVPIIGLCFDGSVMYARRNAELSSTENGRTYSETFKRDYIDIPINLKYKFNFPVISRIVVPYLTTGPNFSFLMGKNRVEGGKRSTVAWSFGLGAELISHLQIGASYNFGITKASDADGVYGKDRYWAVTAAWLF